jgi:hypothetical protein
MNARAIVLTLVLCSVGVAVCSAHDANMGTWTLNEAKSKLGPGAPKNNTVVYEAAGDKVKVTIDGTDKDGNPTHRVDGQVRRERLSRHRRSEFRRTVDHEDRRPYAGVQRQEMRYGDH